MKENNSKCVPSIPQIFIPTTSFLFFQRRKPHIKVMSVSPEKVYNKFEVGYLSRSQEK